MFKQWIVVAGGILDVTVIIRGFLMLKNGLLFFFLLFLLFVIVRLWSANSSTDHYKNCFFFFAQLKKAHAVRVKSFRIAKAPVTNAQV